MTTATIQKATSRGQVTLPAAWWKQFNALLEMAHTVLRIKPVDIAKLSQEETVVFHAKRDNNGKGILAKDFIKIIDNIQIEQLRQRKKKWQKIYKNLDYLSNKGRKISLSKFVIQDRDKH